MKVSVLLTTYNHGPFLTQAIDSILVQETDFDFEIVIGDDCSADNTREILIAFQKKYPSLIRLVLSEKNLGESGNVARTLQVCKGHYVSLLDGDDYWTSVKKLQKQVDFLDQHPECSMCFHNATVFYEDRTREPHPFISIGRNEMLTQDDLWQANIITTCTAMLRRDSIKELPDWFGTMPWGDWPLYLLSSERGKIGYFDELLAAYRVHPGGAWSGLTEIRQLEEVIKFYVNINFHLKFKYNKTIKRMISKYYFRLAIAHLKNGDVAQAKTCARNCILKNPFHVAVPIKDVFKVWRRNALDNIQELISVSQALYRFPGSSNK